MYFLLARMPSWITLCAVSWGECPHEYLYGQALGAHANKYDRIAVERDPHEAQWRAHVDAAVALVAP